MRQLQLGSWTNRGSATSTHPWASLPGCLSGDDGPEEGSFPVTVLISWNGEMLYTKQDGFTNDDGDMMGIWWGYIYNIMGPGDNTYYIYINTYYIYISYIYNRYLDLAIYLDIIQQGIWFGRSQAVKDTANISRSRSYLSKVVEPSVHHLWPGEPWVKLTQW